MADSLGSPEWRREYERSLENPASFWEKQAGQLPWLEQPTDILSQDANGTIRWFAGGLTNTCWLALDRHCDEGRQDSDGPHLRLTRYRSDTALQLPGASRPCGPRSRHVARPRRRKR